MHEKAENKYSERNQNWIAEFLKDECSEGTTKTVTI